MKPLRAFRQSPLKRRHGHSLLARTAFLSAAATLSLSACSHDVLSPAEVGLAQASVLASDATIRRPFKVRQQWDPSGNDFTNPCIAQIPNPAVPGAFIEVPLPGVTHGWGTATHLGRHAVDIHTSSCVWDPGLGAIDVVGHWRLVVASGDTLWGTYEGDLYPMPNGTAEFFGGLTINSGSGRFQNVSGEASFRAHDEPDGSGWDWGSGWIAY